jgi:hypothetical protein
MSERDEISKVLEQVSADAIAVIMLTLRIEEEYLHQRRPRDLGERIAEEIRKVIK